MKNKLLSTVYIVVLTLAATAIAYESWGNAVGYSHTANKITETLHMEDNLKTTGKKILEKITFSWYGGYTEGVDDIKKLKEQNQKYDKNAYRFTKAFIGIVLLSLVLYVIARKRFLLLSLISLSIVALITGWFAPILEITAYQDIPLLGNTIFQYESESIVTTLMKMFENQQYGIAAIILLFTVITPIIKTLLLLTISFQEKLHLSPKRIGFLSSIGKWSMLDVFVVAVIVVAVKLDSLANATPRNGIYIFAVAILLSMALTFYIDKLARQSPS